MSGEVYWEFVRLRSGIIIFFFKFHDKFVTSRYHYETIRRRFYEAVLQENTEKLVKSENFCLQSKKPFLL